jgi:uncharacterized membrane protein YedE/YeeE
MFIDWGHFTPGSAAIGGSLIGVAAAALLLCNGRIAGISGIVGALFRPKHGDVAWRAAFLLGLVAAPLGYRVFAALPEGRIEAGWETLVLAGFLVGLGTRFGSGCTSGHGVCGLSRLSPRSLAATLTFMAAGVVTVYVVRHLLHE